ncbi:MAG: hemolysin family protein [Candidatus Theseobacter exili]|nr:hemolysin family protein [Candidatus Theseobacter exili]
MEIVLQLSILLVLLLCSAFFSGSETALFSLSSFQVKAFEKKKQKNAVKVVRLLSDPRRLMITIVLSNMFVNICASSVSEALCVRFFGVRGLIISILIMTFIILIVGEITPKTIAVQNPEVISLIVSPVITWCMKLLLPLRLFFQAISDFFVGFFIKGQSDSKKITHGEIRTAVSVSEAQGVINPEESRMILNTFSLSKKCVNELMRHRNEIIAFEEKSSVGEVVSGLKENKYSRIPVYQEELDQITGVLYIKDLLSHPISEISNLPISNFSRTAFFVPGVMSAGSLLKELKQKRLHLAIVVDEWGGVEGLITLEDIMEEIVGEVVDKGDEIPLFRRLSSTTIEIKARMEIEKFNEIFATNIKDDNANTIGGYLLNRIGHIPEPGEVFRFDDLSFKVTDAEMNRIEELLISKITIPGKIREKS